MRDQRAWGIRKRDGSARVGISHGAGSERLDQLDLNLTGVFAEIGNVGFRLAELRCEADPGRLFQRRETLPQPHGIGAENGVGEITAADGA